MLEWVGFFGVGLLWWTGCPNRSVVFTPVFEGGVARSSVGTGGSSVGHNCFVANSLLPSLSLSIFLFFVSPLTLSVSVCLSLRLSRSHLFLSRSLSFSVPHPCSCSLFHDAFDLLIAKQRFPSIGRGGKASIFIGRLRHLRE